MFVFECVVVAYAVEIFFIYLGEWMLVAEEIGGAVLFIALVYESSINRISEFRVRLSELEEVRVVEVIAVWLGHLPHTFRRWLLRTAIADWFRVLETKLVGRT